MLTPHLSLGRWEATERNANIRWWRLLHNTVKEHGLPDESETTIKAKLKRGAFAATFLVATLAALEMEGMRLGICRLNQHAVIPRFHDGIGCNVIAPNCDVGGDVNRLV
jgi:hypothetical protein